MIDLSQLSAEEKKALVEQVEQERLQAKKKKKEERETLKNITDETILNVFGSLKKMSESLGLLKKEVYDNFADIIEMKKDVYGDKTAEQHSHTFTTTDGRLRIILGYNTIDDYDDTVDMGIAKVREYIQRLARDEDSKRLVNAVFRLLSKDNKGNLKASRVIQLSKMADESEDEEFIDAVKIIKDAYRPQRTRQYVIAKYRNDATNAWVNVPLGMTEA